MVEHLVADHLPRAMVHRRLDDAGHDRVDVDVVLAELLGHRLGYAYNCSFTGGVIYLSHIPANPSN